MRSGDAWYHRTDAVWDAVIETYMRDPTMTLGECARQLGIARQSVHEQFRKRGVPIRPTKTWRELPVPTMEVQVLDLYVNCPELTTRQIAAVLGTSIQRMAKLLRRHPEIPRRNPLLTEAKQERIAALCTDPRKTLTAIRLEEGVSEKSVRRIARERGCPPRRPGRPRKLTT